MKPYSFNGSNINKHNLIINPLFILALFLLIANDFYLKANYPSWITGKLSDFTGIYIFSIFFGYLLLSKLRSIKSLVIYLITISFVFTIWKIGPITEIFEPLFIKTGLPMPYKTTDPTDLFCLPVLLFSFLQLKKHMGHGYYEIHKGLIKKLSLISLLILSTFSIMATSPLPTKVINVNESIQAPSSLSKPQFLFKIQEILYQNGFSLNTSRHKFEEQYYIEFNYNSKRAKEFFGIENNPKCRFRGEMRIYINEEVGKFEIAAIRIEYYNRQYNEENINSIVLDQLINPLKTEFKK